jgi:hypothetical protein
MISKKVIFYIVLFSLFYILSKTSYYLSNSFKLNQDVVLLFASIILIGIMFLLEKVNFIKDDFHFELTGEKNCEGGDYMTSSDPEKAKFCSQYSPQDLARYNCSRGFHGRPVQYKYSNMSDSDWNNTICDSGFDYNPEVL